MARLLLLPALALLGACAALQTAPPSPAPPAMDAPSPVAAVADRVTIEGTRGLVIAELAYNTAARITLAGVEAGLIKGEAAATARTLNTRAMTALHAAKTAQTAAVQARAVSQAIDAIASLRAISESPR